MVIVMKFKVIFNIRTIMTTGSTVAFTVKLLHFYCRPRVIQEDLDARDHELDNRPRDHYPGARARDDVNRKGAMAQEDLVLGDPISEFPGRISSSVVDGSWGSGNLIRDTRKASSWSAWQEITPTAYAISGLSKGMRMQMQVAGESMINRYTASMQSAQDLSSSAKSLSTHHLHHHRHEPPARQPFCRQLDDFVLP